ncbi:MAG: type III restriction endonuclease subunit M [Treponemataceae bacterium]|nr:MAG: type III restriction endonuclease subunit M [Treponemataceae bacterium]
MPVSAELQKTASAQVVSRERVADYGEVYTAEREVNAMLDMVKSETERVESRFLEPACGTGNFLIEVLRRKLKRIAGRYAQDRIAYERYALIAVGSLYGIDILEDNVMQCRTRLWTQFTNAYMNLFGFYQDENYPESIKFVLQRNIIWGNALTLQSAGDNPEPIIFSEWALLQGGMIKRRDFAFNELLTYTSRADETLFSDENDEVFVPRPVAEYPVVDYLKLWEANKY